MIGQSYLSSGRFQKQLKYSTKFSQIQITSKKVQKNVRKIEQADVPVVLQTASHSNALARTMDKPAEIVASPLKKIRNLLYQKGDNVIWALTFPVLCSNFLDPIISMVDSAIIGRLGTDQLAGAGVGFAAQVIVWCFAFLSLLTTPKVARAYAVGDRSTISQVSSNAMQLAFCLGLIPTCLVLALSGTVVSNLSIEPQVGMYALNYMRMRCLSNPFQLVSFVAIGTFRGMQDTKTPFLACMLGNISNLMMDILFVYGFHWGVTGAALATSISQVLTTSTLIYLLLKKKVLTFQHLKQLPLLSEVVDMLKAGAALSSRTLMVSAAIISTNFQITSVGAVATASFECIRQVWMLSYVMYEGFNSASQSLIALNMGKNDIKQAYAHFTRILQLVVITAIFQGTLLTVFRQKFFGIFTQSTAVVATVASVLPILILSMPFDAVAAVCDGSLLAAGQFKYMALFTMVSASVVIVAQQVLGATGCVSLLSVCVALRLMGVTRFFSGVHRNFFSDKSPFASVLRGGAEGGVSGGEEEEGQGVEVEKVVEVETVSQVVDK